MNILRYLFLVACTCFGLVCRAQNYTSVGNGNWTTAANWNNTSGWGNVTPQSGQSSGTTNVNNTLVFIGNYSAGSATININSTGNMNVIGDFAIGGGGTVNVYGTLDSSGSATLNSALRIYPGGKVIIDGNLTVVSSNNLIVGTSAAPPAYADLVVKGNVISQTSGDITVNRNGRVAIYGDVTGTGGGTLFTVNNGGQVYIDGDLSFTGGGSHVYNNNVISPYGLYINGSASTSGGGSSLTSNRGNRVDLQNGNPDFYTWLVSQENSPLPVVLLYFNVDDRKPNVLVWATASQLNFSHFEIENSIDGDVWKKLGEVKGEGTTNELRKFSFEHTHAPKGTNYYRLKMVDLDNTFDYSAIIKSNIIGDYSFDVFPNPVVNKTIQFSSNFALSEGDFLLLFDLSGTLVWQSQADFTQAIALPESLMPGTYLLQFKSAQKKLTLVKRVVIN
ncbi:MAG: T9SS type A sorting domain-containing protein [Chryseotalea sp.]|jgi:hypothetical protein